MSGVSIQDLLNRRAEEEPDRPFVIYGATTLSYGRVQSQARSLAAALHNLGIEAGDAIAIDLPNWPEFVVSTLAAANLGARIVPLNPGGSPHETQFVLRNTEASVVIAAERYDGADNMELLERMQAELPDLGYVVTVGEEDLWYDDRIFQFEDLVSAGEGKSAPEPPVEPGEDVFAILYTAGTTGKPKGVMLTHANLVQTNAATARALRLGPEDVVLVAVPLFTIFGLGTLVAALSAGASVVLMERFDADESLRLIEEAGVTVVNGVPTMFVMQLRSPELAARDLSGVRTGIVAGASVAVELAREARAFVPDLEIAYGMTETSPTVSLTEPSMAGEKRGFTVGRPLPGVEVKVLGEDGSALPSESIGELAIRGYNVMKGYYRQPEETSRAFTADGFFRTGDLAMLDDEGCLHVVGRQKDTIVRGGYEVYPREIEDVLNLHAGVEDSIVVGVENDVLGELICACILPVEGAIVTGEEIKEFCKGQIAQYKMPDIIRFVDTFPLTGSGKVRRVELVRMVSAESPSRRSESL